MGRGWGGRAGGPGAGGCQGGTGWVFPGARVLKRRGLWCRRGPLEGPGGGQGTGCLFTRAAGATCQPWGEGPAGVLPPWDPGPLRYDVTAGPFLRV